MLRASAGHTGRRWFWLRPDRWSCPCRFGFALAKSVLLWPADGVSRCCPCQRWRVIASPSSIASGRPRFRSFPPLSKYGMQVRYDPLIQRSYALIFSFELICAEAGATLDGNLPAVYLTPNAQGCFPSPGAPPNFFKAPKGSFSANPQAFTGSGRALPSASQRS
jgi:hypothetical protein